jgi:hypothetical protein
MNPNLYDAELRMQQHRQLAQAAADAYHQTPHAPRRALRGAYRRSRLVTGSALIALGQRLQAGLTAQQAITH